MPLSTSPHENTTGSPQTDRQSNDQTIIPPMFHSCRHQFSRHSWRRRRRRVVTKSAVGPSKFAVESTQQRDSIGFPSTQASAACQNAAMQSKTRPDELLWAFWAFKEPASAHVRNALLAVRTLARCAFFARYRGRRNGVRQSRRLVLLRGWVRSDVRSPKGNLKLRDGVYLVTSG
jgi:hypothetical protein